MNFQVNTLTSIPCYLDRMEVQETEQLDLELFGHRLRWAIDNSEYNAAQLAQLVDVTKTTAGNWAKDSCEGINSNKLYLVARTLQVCPKWLATGEGSPDITKDPDQEELSSLIADGMAKHGEALFRSFPPDVMAHAIIEIRENKEASATYKIR